MALLFEQLHGLLLAMTPQEQPPGQRARYETDLRRVKTVEQLPPRLLMGYRDDSSFTRTGDRFEIGYTLDGERVLDLQVEGDRFVWHQRWHGLEGGGGTAAADKLGLMVQGLQVFDNWQGELERELRARGNFGWVRQEFEDLHIAGLPDGVIVQVAFPIDGSTLEELARFYERLWAEPTASMRPVAHVLFTSLPVTHRWSAQAESVAPRDWAWRFWEVYSSGLGLQQPFPGEPTVSDEGGIAITIAREGFLHIATLPLRDLLPFAGRLVENGLVAEHRFEDEPYDQEGWGWTTAPFRAMAAAVGTAAERDVVFADDEGSIACVYPTAAAARVHVDASRARAFDGLGFERVLELARQTGGAIVGVNARMDVVNDKWKSDPEGAAKQRIEEDDQGAA